MDADATDLKKSLRVELWPFVAIHHVNVNTCSNNLVQGVVGSEDDAGLRCSTRNVVEHCDLVRFSGGEILSLTTVNMTDMRPCVRYLFHELTAKLVCKENTWSNNYDGFRTTLESIDCINNHAQSLTTTSRNKDATFVEFLHLGDDAGLVGTKNHVRASQCQYTRKPPWGQGGWDSLSVVHQVTVFV